MLVAVSGYREFNDYAYFCKKLSLIEIDKMVFGDCRGADALAERYCIEHDIPYKKLRADWGTYGKSAGPKRNRAILDEKPDIIFLFLHPLSKGTRDMLKAVKKRDISYIVYHI